MYKCLVVVMVFSFLDTVLPRPVVMLSPAGHAKEPGRKLLEGYERGVARQLVEVVRNGIQEHYGVSCELSHAPGEVLDNTFCASFANRLGVSLYVSFHVCIQEELKPRIAVYYVTCDPLGEAAFTEQSKLSLIPLRRAHCLGRLQTRRFAKELCLGLSKKKYQSLVTCLGPYGFPFKPLIGITAPALGVEVIVNKDADWKNVVAPLLDALSFVKHL